MAAPTLVKGGYLTIMIGDGAGSEVFSILCGLTTRNFTEQVNTSDQFVADCADPEAVPNRALNLTGHQWSLTGEGLFNTAQEAILRAAIGLPKNFRFTIGKKVTPSTGTQPYYMGSGVITNRQLTGADGSYSTQSISIESDGAWTFVAGT